MKVLNTLLITVFASGLALAAPPQNHRADRYKDLYLKSALTDPPIVEKPDEIPSDLPDWVLVGVSKYIGKTEVQIMNIKDRSRVTIPSKDATELGFSIKKVDHNRNYLKDSVVTLEKGNDTGEVRFDAKYLVLKKVAGPTAQRPAVAGKTGTRSNGRTGAQPPTPPGVGSSKGATSAKPGAVPQPSAAKTSTTTRAASTSSKSKRTRYVPRPSKTK